MNSQRASYGPYSPDGPEHFPVVYAKTMETIRTEPEVDPATLADVHVPTLVLQGDRDLVSVEHSATARVPVGWLRPSCEGRLHKPL